MSINLLLEMSRRSFRSLDAAMNTVGQNIANAGTDGYTRRRVTLQADSLNSTGVWFRPDGNGAVGAGASVQSYERLRDGLLQRSAWQMKNAMSFSEEQHRVLGALQGLFPVGSDGALGQQLSQFWNGWSDLADNPADKGVRLSLRARAAGLASTLNRLDADVARLTTETQATLASGVEDTNRILDKIAELNEVISRANFQGSPNNDAYDQRDNLVNKLMEFASVRVQETSSGALTVTLEGVALVQDTTVQKLELDTNQTTPRLFFKGTDRTVNASSDAAGRLGAWLQTMQQDLPNARAALDTLADTLVRQVNGLHTTGYGLNGQTGVNFFHYAQNGSVEEGVTAASIRLSDEVASDSAYIVSSAGDPADGDNDSSIALAITGLRDAKLFGDASTTAETFVIDLVSDMGARIERAQAQYSSRTASANHLEAMERGVSGVSLDEEMTSLIRYQQSYQASARLLSSVQDMFDILMSM